MGNKIEINDHVDHQRWLLEHGFINDLHKDNLYMYGAIAHKDIKGLQLDIDVSNKIVTYSIYCDTSLLGKIDKYKRLSQSKGILGLWRFKRLLKKEGNLNFKFLLNTFVKDYCGPKWQVKLNLEDYENYEDGFKEQEQEQESEKGREVNK